MSLASSSTERLRALAVAALMVCSGCAGPRSAQFSDPSLGEIGSGELVLMPVIDERSNRLDQFDVGRHVSLAADKVLAKKGYTVLTSRHLEGAERPPFEGIGSLSAAELSRLGPEGSRLLLFIAVDDVSYEYERFGDEYEVRVSGLLVDRRHERVIWRDNGSGRSTFGGLLGVMSGGRQYDAVHSALANLLRTVPDHQQEASALRRTRS